LLPLAILASLALGSIHVGLVPPYLALMAWLVLAPNRRARPAPAVEGGDPTSQAPTVDGDHACPVVPVSPTFEGRGADRSGAIAAASCGALKSRRSRKAKATAVEPAAPADVAWVCVGPGKFVRVEAGRRVEPTPTIAPGLPPLDPAWQELAVVGEGQA